MGERDDAWPKFEKSNNGSKVVRNAIFIPEKPKAQRRTNQVRVQRRSEGWFANASNAFKTRFVLSALLALLLLPAVGLFWPAQKGADGPVARGTIEIDKDLLARFAALDQRNDQYARGSRVRLALPIASKVQTDPAVAETDAEPGADPHHPASEIDARSLAHVADIAEPLRLASLDVPQNNPTGRLWRDSPETGVGVALDTLPRNAADEIVLETNGFAAHRIAFQPGGRPLVAIIIDDVGMNRKQARRAIDLPGSVTLAMLPYAPKLKRLALRAKQRGHELLVHMPMQPKTANDPGPNALLVGLTEAELIRRIEWNLTQFQGFVGINNHMGSLFTETPAPMRQLFRRLKSGGYMFVDSRTTAQSASVEMAERFDVPFAERDIFLDNHKVAIEVAAQLEKLTQKALANGTAVGIGHPHKVTIDAIAAWAPTLEARGVDLAPISAIAEARGTPLWRTAIAEAAFQ
ncbi:MAG: divergent polysaccharide deacetylase family protein [Pseudomonadota bacterium]